MWKFLTACHFTHSGCVCFFPFFYIMVSFHIGMDFEFVEMTKGIGVETCSLNRFAVLHTNHRMTCMLEGKRDHAHLISGLSVVKFCVCFWQIH